MDLIKPNGYLQCWRERNGTTEQLYSNPNSAGTHYWACLLTNLINRGGVPIGKSGRTIYSDLDTYQIDGMAIGSCDEANQYPTIWATWAGTFGFGSNANFSSFQFQDESGVYPIATFYGTFVFTGFATVNYINLGCGSYILENIHAYTKLAAPLAYKDLFGELNQVFANNDILRVNWSISIA